jgi:hypothetical protein
MVLGCPRSGTSMAAAMLHTLGVDMGTGHLQPVDERNPKGYYEDLRWQAVNKRVIGMGYAYAWVDVVKQRHADEYAALAAECEQARQLWGMKDPRLCFTARFVWPLLADCRMVVIRRDLMATVASIEAHSRTAYKRRKVMTWQQAGKLQVDWSAALDRTLNQFPGHVLFLKYEDVIAEPLHAARQLAGFVADGLALQVPELKVKAAANVPDPGLDHYG